MPLTFEIGQSYYSPVYKADYYCVRRFFECDGLLEIVVLARKDSDGNIYGEFERTARCMAPMFGIEEYRGGVSDARFCKHDLGFITTKTWGDICPNCGKSK